MNEDEFAKEFWNDSIRILREELPSQGTRLTDLIDTLERSSDLQAGYYVFAHIKGALPNIWGKRLA